MWTNPKYGKKPFKSSYEYEESGERVFVLTRVDGGRRVTFESFHAAKKLGWVREK